MTTNKQKSVRDFRGRFKKRRYASPSETREIFDRMYERGERGEREREAHLRTPEGERERQARNAATLERLRKNPRKRRGVTSGAVAQIFSGLTHPEGGKADFHALRSDDVQYLHDTAKEVGYRAPKNASGSLARMFFEHLKRREKGPWSLSRTRKNPVGKFVIVGHTPSGQFYYRASAKVFEDGKRGLERATRYKSRSHAERIAEEISSKLPARMKNLLVEVFQ